MLLPVFHALIGVLAPETTALPTGSVLLPSDAPGSPVCSAADARRFNGLVHGGDQNPALSVASYTDPAADGVWVRSLDDLGDYSKGTSFYADPSVFVGASTCPTRETAVTIKPEDIPPWCPGVGDKAIANDPDRAFHFNASQMGRYSMSIINNAICWRVGPSPETDFRSVYGLPHLRGGMLMLPWKIKDQALCFYVRDSGSVMRRNCGCGESVEVPRGDDGLPLEGNASPGSGEKESWSFQDENYVGDSNCAGDRSTYRNKTDAAVDEYLRRFYRAENTSEMNMASLNAEAFTKVAQRQLQWDRGGEREQPAGWMAGYNEVLVPAWFGIKYQEVPMDAWFYFGHESPNVEANNRDLIVAIRNAYSRASGRILPVLRINATECHEQPFTCV